VDCRDERTVIGTFVRFEQGDYVHPVIAASDGDTLSFWLPDEEPLLGIYLAETRGRQMEFVIRATKSYIQEIDSWIICDQVVDAIQDGLGFGQWLSELTDSLSSEQIWALYGDEFEAAFE
jgi:hypothetical protein